MRLAKDPRKREKDFLGFVAHLPCVICLSGGVMERHVQVAHIRAGSLEHGKRPTGGGEKPSDRWVTPLCAQHHVHGNYSQHNFPGGEEAFWAHHGISPFNLANDLHEAFASGRDGAPVIAKHAASGIRARHHPR